LKYPAWHRFGSSFCGEFGHAISQEQATISPGGVTMTFATELWKAAKRAFKVYGTILLIIVVIVLAVYHYRLDLQPILRTLSMSVQTTTSGAIDGFLDGSALGYAIGKEAPNLYCPPKEGISVVQGRLIIDAHFKNHPEKLHKEAAAVVMDALVDAFNCPTR
jgi:Rap1a immunity proteins